MSEVEISHGGNYQFRCDSKTCERPECVEMRRHMEMMRSGRKCDDVVFRQETEWIFRQMDEIEKLRAVAKAARQLIYPPRTDYAPGSKKAALKLAIEKLEKK